MTKIFSSMSKGEGAAPEYKDLDGRSVVDELTPDSDGLRRDILLLAGGIFAIGIGIWYIMLGGCYLPPEAGPDGGAAGIVIASAGLVGLGAATLADLAVRRCSSSQTDSC